MVWLCLGVEGCNKNDVEPVPEPPTPGLSWIDPDFAQALQTLGYIKDAGTVTPEDVEKITRLDLDPLGDSPETRWLTSLKGIECFKSLEFILIGVNRVENLDLSNLSKLKYVDCGHNRLVNLKLIGLSNLETLICDRNNLKSLDLSGCEALSYLNCGDNPIDTLDVSCCPALQTLCCADNQLCILDISTNKYLEILDCSENFDLTDISLPEDGKLKSIDCSCMAGYELSVPANPDLKKIICVSSGLKYLSGVGLSCVEDIDVSRSSISQDELKQLEHLRYLKCDYMGWTKGDFSSNLELEKLSCVGNKMSEIIVKDNTKLHLLNCSDNCLVSVNLSNNRELTELLCDRNQIDTIDITALIHLNRLSISHNLLTSLELENNGELNYLDCSENMLEGLDVSHCPNLSNLNVTGNPGKNRKFSLLTGYNTSLRLSADSWPYKSWYVTIEKTGM